MNKIKEVFNFVKTNIMSLYSIFFMILLILDYLIYVNVFHLNQAFFFNDLLKDIASTQYLMLFILFPMFIFGFFLSLLKIEYDILKKINDNKSNLNFEKYKSIFFVIFVIIFIFFSEWICFTVLDYLLEKFKIYFNQLHFVGFLYLIFLFVNILTMKSLYFIQYFVKNKK